MGREILLRPERCILCMACEVACAREHGGNQRLRLVPHDGRGAPVACRQCHSATCVTACPTGALEQCDGVVYLRMDRCTGCELCLWACPFGAIGLDVDQKQAIKCDLCQERQEAGLEPVCVLTCPSQALVRECVADFASRRRDIAGRSWATGWARRGS